MTGSEFEATVREHQAMVYSIAYNFAGDVATAEEIAQEVFLQLFRARDTLESPAHVKHWLRRTATHRSIDVLRRRGRRSEVSMYELPEIPAPRRERDPLVIQRLQRLVRALPAKPRAVILLRYGEDMDVREIGDVLEMPVPTVWSHLRRSIQTLRERFAGVDARVDPAEEVGESRQRGAS